MTNGNGRVLISMTSTMLSTRLRARLGASSLATSRASRLSMAVVAISTVALSVRWGGSGARHVVRRLDMRSVGGSLGMLRLVFLFIIHVCCSVVRFKKFITNYKMQNKLSPDYSPP